MRFCRPARSEKIADDAAKHAQRPVSPPLGRIERRRKGKPFSSGFAPTLRLSEAKSPRLTYAGSNYPGSPRICSEKFIQKLSPAARFLTHHLAMKCLQESIFALAEPGSRIQCTQKSVSWLGSAASQLDLGQEPWEIESRRLEIQAHRSQFSEFANFRLKRATSRCTAMSPRMHSAALASQRPRCPRGSQRSQRAPHFHTPLL